MSISRRRFLQTGAVAAVAVTIAGNPLQTFAQKGGQKGGQLAATPPYFPVPYASRLDPVFYLKKVSFTPYLNTQFSVRGSGKQGGLLTLVEVDDLRSGGDAAAAGRDGFSLLFTGTSKKPLAQDVYRITHDALGEFSLLLVRVSAPSKGRVYYEAIINRLNV